MTTDHGALRLHHCGLSGKGDPEILAQILQGDRKK